MPLTLSQYAEYLDTRKDLSWPASPTVEKPTAVAYLEWLPQVRVVSWSVYGTLLGISGGELHIEHPHKFTMDLSLDKTLQEFKMWGSMTRKPGRPAEYLGQLYARALEEQRTAPSPGEKHPEIRVEAVWENIINKLRQKDYKYDESFFGSLGDFSRKVAYFFHASLQAAACYADTIRALQTVKQAGLQQAIVDNGQFFTPIQLHRELKRLDKNVELSEFISSELCVFSCQFRARKPSEHLFRHLLSILRQKGIRAEQVLHIGSSIERDIFPAKRLNMHTALFAGDANSLRATNAQFQDVANRPDLLMTELSQIGEVVGRSE